jgi:16S rRNA (guanine527-N7)-methyltransferase
MDLGWRIQNGIVQMGLELPAQSVPQFVQYLELLHKWNKTFNLTAVRTLDDMVSLHLLDSLSIVPFIKGPAILDVGTGAGLPGIPLSIVYPDLQFTLLDSNAKKIRFCRQAINELGLKNIRAEHARIEEIAEKLDVQQVTTRAFTDLPNMAKLMEPLLQRGAEILAMKGHLPADEITRLENSGLTVSHRALDVPWLNAERNLLLIKKP